LGDGVYISLGCFQDNSISIFYPFVLVFPNSSGQMLILFAMLRQLLIERVF